MQSIMHIIYVNPLQSGVNFLSQEALVVSTSRCRHSTMTFAVRNLVRCPLIICAICIFFFFEGGMTVFAARSMLLGMFVQMAYDWKRLSLLKSVGQIQQMDIVIKVRLVRC